MRKFLKISFALFTLVFTISALAQTAAEADGTKCTFLGETDSGKRIVYVFDCSGSILNIFDSVRHDILKSVDGLKPEQLFNIVCFQEQSFRAVDGKIMLSITPKNRRRACDFLDHMYVKGETNPIPGLEFAFKQEADLIYLLVDGDFNGPGNEAVVKFCKEKAGKAKINTIAFISKDNTDKREDMEFVKALKAITKNSGGKFRIVTEDDMSK